MAVLMYDGSQGRCEGADVHMPNADISRISIAPLTSSFTCVGAQHMSSQIEEAIQLAVVTLPMSDMTVCESRDRKTTSDNSLFWRVGHISI